MINGMEEKVESMLKEILAQYEGGDEILRKIEASHKTANQNPLENSMWANMLDGALKAVEVVSVATFDYKLLAITKLLQSWISEKREEIRKTHQDVTLGVNYNITHPNNQVQVYDPYGGNYTY